MRSRLCQTLLISVLSFCLDGPAAVAQDVRDADKVKSTVADVLSDPEVRHLQKDESEPDEEFELPEWFKSFIEWLFESRDVSPSVNADFDPATGVPTSYGFDQSRLIADTPVAGSKSA